MIESLQLKRKALKSSIRSFIKDFERVNGRKPRDDEYDNDIRGLFEERKELGDRIESLEAKAKSAKAESETLESRGGDAATAASPPVGNDEKFSLSSMRKRRAKWMRERFNQIQREVDNIDGGGASKASNVKASKWDMLKAVVDVPLARGAADDAKSELAIGRKGNFLPLPPHLSLAKLREEVKVGDEFIQDAEDALRNPFVEPPPIPPSKSFRSIMDDGSFLKKELPEDYVVKFRDAAPAQELAVTSIPTSDLQERSRLLEESKIESAKAEVRVFMAREADLAVREGNARKRIDAKEQQAIERIKVLKEDEAKREELFRRRIGRHFLRAKIMLEEKLKRQKVRLRTRAQKKIYIYIYKICCRSWRRPNAIICRRLC